MSYLFLGAASLLFFAAWVHSLVGEHLLVIPLLKGDVPPFFGSATLARRTLRMVWHLLTVVWLGLVALLVVLADPAVDLQRAVPWVLIVVCVATAALSLTITRGKHVLSWLAPLAAAVLIWAARSPDNAAADVRLERVAAIHGGAGPWAVAGYRMGQFALRQLDLQRHSFDLEIEHHTPSEVQYSCIADGAAAATGASSGKLNLRVIESSQVETQYRRKSTGAVVTLRPAPAFVQRFKDVSYTGFEQAAREILALPDEAIFEVIAAR